MTNIMLIGAGKLGSRHLQALSQVQLKDTNLYVVDLNQEALDLSEKRFNDMPKNKNIKSIKYSLDIKNIKAFEIDLAIIATTSEYRKRVIQDLCLLKKVNNIILEKFLFQDEESYYEVEKILTNSEIQTWVNCPRREWSIYEDIKAKLEDSKILQFDVTGTKWSIATSAIHFIDLIAYITDDTNFNITNMDFGNKPVPAYSVITGSRESKYIEFFGSLHGKFNSGTFFNFTCIKEKTPFTVTIQTQNKKIIIFEEFGKYYTYTTNEDGLSFEEELFTMPFQSQLTNIVAEKVIHDKDCLLTKYHESSKLHITLLKSYLSYLEKINPTSSKVCPLT